MARNIVVPRGGNGQLSGRPYTPPERKSHGGSFMSPPNVYEYHGPVTPRVKGVKIKPPKELYIVPLKVESMEELDPFVKAHRVGVKDLVTEMDPMGEEFIRSLNLSYSKNSSVTAQSSSISISNFSWITQGLGSRAIKKLIPEFDKFVIDDLGNLGNPWTADAPIRPQFQVGTAVISHKTLTPPSEEGLASIRFVLDLWKHRKPEFPCANAGETSTTLLTLINVFTPDPRLACYSFVAKKGTEECLYNVWINDTYLTNGSKRLPMYFEMAGALSYIYNVTLAHLGISIDATGQAWLNVESKRERISKPLYSDSVNELKVKGRLTFLPSNTGDLLRSIGLDMLDSVVQQFDFMNNVNWSKLGSELSSNSIWTTIGGIRHLPWQVQAVMKKVLDRREISRLTFTEALFSSTKDSVEFFSKPVLVREEMLPKLMGSKFWAGLRGIRASNFDSLIYDLRKGYISTELVEEQLRLDPSKSAEDAQTLLRENSPELGRFVFERNLPKPKVEYVEAVEELVQVGKLPWPKKARVEAPSE